jgi:DNA gyrase subunit B
VKKGNSQVYIRDEKALNEYLLDSAASIASLKFANGEVVSSNDLRDMAVKSEIFKNHVEHINNKINNSFLLETLLLLGLHKNPDLDKSVIINQLQKKESRVVWDMESTETHYIFTKTHRKVKETFEVSRALFATAEIQSVDEKTNVLRAFLNSPAELKIKDTSVLVQSPMDFLEKCIQGSKKGMSINRYKGLGEMDAEQLWETTIDPHARILMQVKCEHFDDVDEVFSTLMGDVVEPRREFIQENALNVVNLDV